MNRMKSKNVLALFAACLIVLTVFMGSMTSSAASRKNYRIEENPDTGFMAILVDQADLLSETEEKEVMESMMGITSQATAIFVAVDKPHTGDIVKYAKKNLEDICYTVYQDGYNSVIFMVDMDYRELVTYAGEELSPILTKAMANTITDNVYRYASDGNFSKCAVKAFEQIYRLLDGQKIAQPMRFITAGLLALFVGLAIALLVIRKKTARHTTSYAEVMRALLIKEVAPVVKVTKKSERRTKRVTYSYSSGSSFGSRNSFGSTFSSGSSFSSHSSSFGSSFSSGSSFRSSGSSFHSSGGSHSRGSSGHGSGGSHRF